MLCGGARTPAVFSSLRPRPRGREAFSPQHAGLAQKESVVHDSPPPHGEVRRLSEADGEAALWADLESLLPEKDWAALLAELDAASAERNASAPPNASALPNASARRLHDQPPEPESFLRNGWQ